MEENQTKLTNLLEDNLAHPLASRHHVRMLLLLFLLLRTVNDVALASEPIQRASSIPLVFSAMRIAHPKNGETYSSTAPLEFRFLLSVSDRSRFLHEYEDRCLLCVEFDHGATQRCKTPPLVFYDLPVGNHSARISLYDGASKALWIQTEEVAFAIMSDEEIEAQLAQKKARERALYGIPDDLDLLTWWRRSQHPNASVSSPEDIVRINTAADTGAQIPEQERPDEEHLPPVLVIGVKSSSVGGFPQRQAIRDTWANSSGSLSRDVKVLFLCCRPLLAHSDPAAGELLDAVEREKQRYGDLLTDELDCDDSYAQLTEKVKEFLHFVVTSVEFRNARYVMIADDDIYLRVDELAHALRRHGSDITRFFAGQVWAKGFVYPVRDPRHWHYLPVEQYPMPELPPFAHSPHYLMSIDCAQFIARNRKRLAGLGGMDDISVTLWLMTMQVHPEHLPQFRNLRGSLPHKCEDSLISFADLSASAIRIIHGNLQHGEQLCRGFDASTWGKRESHPQWMKKHEDGRARAVKPPVTFHTSIQHRSSRGQDVGDALEVHTEMNFANRLVAKFSYSPAAEDFASYCSRIAQYFEEKNLQLWDNELESSTALADLLERFRRHMLTMTKQALHGGTQSRRSATEQFDRDGHEDHPELVRWRQSLHT